MDYSAPIGEYRAYSAPGAQPKALGVMILILTAMLAFYYIQAKGLEHWSQVDTVIDRAAVTYHSGRRGTSGHYDIDVTCAYKVGDHYYEHNIDSYKSWFYWETQAQSTANGLVHTKVVLLYDPANPGHSLTEGEVSANHLVAPLALGGMLVSGFIGLAFLTVGLMADTAHKSYSAR